MGAWIETTDNLLVGAQVKSHPTWVRGLKLKVGNIIDCMIKVAPYVGAWIETWKDVFILKHDNVAPYVGAWIETLWR